MKKRWEEIIDAVSVVKPECVNTERINMMLDLDMTVDAQALDNLYILGALSLDEYKRRMSRHVEYMKEVIHWAEERIKTANEKGTEYNPMIFYGFGRAYMGAGIEEKLQKDDANG